MKTMWSFFAKTYSIGLEENVYNLLHSQVQSAKPSAAEKSFESILAAYLVHIIVNTACINNRQLWLLINWSEAKRLFESNAVIKPHVDSINFADHAEIDAEWSIDLHILNLTNQRAQNPVTFALVET